jgi:hypothetical protein
LNESLGEVVDLGVEIPCFGPQSRPFTELEGFGVYRTENRAWSAVAACPEIWVEAEEERRENSLRITSRFVGLKSDCPLFFAFYAKASGARVGSESFQPRSLHRYSGIARPVVFDDKLIISSTSPGKMELIPLSGDGSFFGCSFLLAFEILLCEANILFDILSRVSLAK